MPTIEDAIELALNCYRGRVDKAGKPYIFHALRVMLAVVGDDERTVAVLHDVIEDTPTTLDDLKTLGYSSRVLDGIDAMTRRYHESYDCFVERAGRDPIARKVKLADLDDNLDVRRLSSIDESAIQRLNRYLKARKNLDS